MSTSQPRSRPEQGDSQTLDGKLPEIVCIPESKCLPSQPLKEQKLPILRCDQRFSDTIISGKSFGTRLFEDSWKNAVLKTKRIKQTEYTCAYGLRNSDENAAMPSLTQGSEQYSSIAAPTPVTQMAQGAANSFPNSSYSNDDPGLPPLCMHSSASSYFSFGNLYKSRGETAMGDINKKGTCPWKPEPLKTSGVHGGAGEIGAVRMKKHNRYSSLISFPDGSKFNSGYRFPDPLRGAPPEYLRRLSELAALECETVHHEKSRKTWKTTKQEI
ncbi:hypothetical protein JRQ81_012823 [Phrynocephalus forsythii]|uniref:Uncharacterized protein n=1 Tax=Phrynocephalus forsythii TaxID=171643 RepID=A0A9Q0Y1T0_9SAUR|nr:hypothetical protein JRQ81_012823 [Phrynocephalus forsythii]